MQTLRYDIEAEYAWKYLYLLYSMFRNQALFFFDFLDFLGFAYYALT